MIEHSETSQPVTEHRHPTSRDDLRAAVVDLISVARREILLCSPALDPALFNRAVVTDALSHFITRQARGRIRVVVEDTEQMLQSCVRLVELARRFSDILLILRLGEPQRGLTEMLMVVDSASCLQQPDTAVIDATLDLNAPQRAITLAHRFEKIWANCDPVPGLHGFRL